MKKMALALSLAATLAWGPAARAQGLSSEEALRATHDLLMQAVKSADVSIVATVVHPQAIGFFREGQRAVELRPGLTVTDIVSPILADLSLFSVTRYDTIVRQIGEVGVVTLSGTLDAGKKTRPRYIRSTYVYIRSGPTWKLLSWHTSDAPVKK